LNLFNKISEQDVGRLTYTLSEADSNLQLGGKIM